MMANKAKKERKRKKKKKEEKTREKMVLADLSLRTQSSPPLLSLCESALNVFSALLIWALMAAPRLVWRGKRTCFVVFAFVCVAGVGFLGKKVVF